ncbi:phage tail sheath family protein [Herbaspirillum autotrophicum]|uniref:phage tail sheath family protein n=1 Tax=Herbaspirillum autotrophicum TaxID=180195 RepID=UPI001E28B7A0|nr:phage tail sheath C-terminal domain-containing protein [Herbaspirillum autotrophicum]
MMTKYKILDDGVTAKNACSESVAEVATAVPAFIGYTEWSHNQKTGLSQQAWRITSMSEFVACYGGPPPSKFSIHALAAPAADGAGIAGDFSVPDSVSGHSEAYELRREDTPYILYYSMLLYFQNGGGACYIVSAGHYGDRLDAGKLCAGIDSLLTEPEPTMMLVPDAMHLSAPDCATVQRHALQHCGLQRNRIALLDVHRGHQHRQHADGDCVAAFRAAVGSEFLDFGTSFYPWVNTSVVKEKGIDFTAITNLDVLAGLLQRELSPVINTGHPTAAAKIMIDHVKALLVALTSDWSKSKDPVTEMLMLNETLLTITSLYPQIMQAIRKKLNLLPPAACMAGLYNMADNMYGVWKDLSNIGMYGVVSPAAAISNDEQEDLAGAAHGASINAIRSFIGQGVLVWGARTLDGNSPIWRDVSTRRTMIMIEQSVRRACRHITQEPNTASTWVFVKSMVCNYLISVWRRGGLAGVSPDEAFSVRVGLGETMSAEDVLQGVMTVAVLVAPSRPAEFIDISFQQQMRQN